jgi:hypothetical protein
MLTSSDFLFYSFNAESLWVAQAGLELMIHLPPPPECWDHRYALNVE